MPEYHNVQAYLSLDGRSHHDAMGMFSDFLAMTTPRTDAYAAWLGARSSGLLSAEGYEPLGPALTAAIGPTVLEVRPLISLWTALPGGRR